jgi:hypothetical protein
VVRAADINPEVMGSSPISFFLLLKIRRSHMKITETMLSYILKKGILYEAKNPNMVIEIPVGSEGKITKVHFTADNMTLRVEKGE